MKTKCPTKSTNDLPPILVRLAIILKLVNFTKAAVSGKIETKLKIRKNRVENYIDVMNSTPGS